MSPCDFRSSIGDSLAVLIHDLTAVIQFQIDSVQLLPDEFVQRIFVLIDSLRLLLF
ncbi:hypothetical protein [Bacillus phage FI_KG-Lek]|nr:hypothetical protein [Bacillus phage FI_KG-Lek]